MFGESMASHRLFCIALMAAYLVLIARIGRRFGLTTAATTLAGVMMFCAKYSCYHFLLVVDGVHSAQGIAGALAVLAILRWVDSGAFAWLCASGAAFAVSVLLREDSIAMAPVLVVLATLASRRAAKLAEQQRSIDRLRLPAGDHFAGGFARQAKHPDARNRLAVEWTTGRGAPPGRCDHARRVATVDPGPDLRRDLCAVAGRSRAFEA